MNMANNRLSRAEKEDMFSNPERMSLYQIINLMPLDQLKHFLDIVNISTDGSISDLRLRLYRHEIQHSPSSEMLSDRMKAMKLYDRQSRDRQQIHNIPNQPYGVGVLGQPKPVEQPHVENNRSFHAQQEQELLDIINKHQCRKELVASHRKLFQMVNGAANPSGPLINSGIPNTPAGYGLQFQTTSTNDTRMLSERIGINPSPDAGVEYNQAAPVDAWCTGMQYQTVPVSTRQGAQVQESFDKSARSRELKIDQTLKQLQNELLDMKSQIQAATEAAESSKESASQHTSTVEAMKQRLKIEIDHLQSAAMKRVKMDDALQKASKMQEQSASSEQSDTKNAEGNFSGNPNKNIEDYGESSSESENSEEDDDESSSESQDNDEDDDIEHRLKCMDLLKTWNLQFHGLKGAEASEFIGYLKDFRKFAKIDDSLLLEMLPAILDDNTRKWYRNKKFDSWKIFEKAFNVEYVHHCEGY